MEYKRFGDTVALRLDKNDEIIESVMQVAKAENIRVASVTGIGGTDDFTIGVFNMEKHEYNKFSFSGTHEITSLVGNINTMEGKPYVHLHITAAGQDGGNIVGGHLLRCVISLTAEIFITEVDGTIDRKRDEDLKINKWKF